MDKQILAFWDDLNFYINGYGIAKFNNKYGIVNFNMEIIVPLIWKSIEIFINKQDEISNVAIVKKGVDKAYLIDYQTNKILSKEYLDIRNNSNYNAFDFFSKNCSKNILTLEGAEFTGEAATNYLNSQIYYSNDRSSENAKFIKYISRKEQNLKYALTTDDNVNITPFIFDGIQHWKTNDAIFIHANIGNRYFLIDENGFVLLRNLRKSNMLLLNQVDLQINWEEILHFEHIATLHWKSKVFKVLIEGYWHILLENFTISDIAWKSEKSDFRYDYYTNYYYQKGFPYIMRNTFEEAIINEEGHFIKSWYFKGFRKLSNGITIVRRVGLIGILWELENKVEKKASWIDVRNFNDKYIIVKLGKNKHVFVDENGVEKTDLIFEEIRRNTDNIVLLKINDKWTEMTIR